MRERQRQKETERNRERERFWDVRLVFHFNNSNLTCIKLIVEDDFVFLRLFKIK